MQARAVVTSLAGAVLTALDEWHGRLGRDRFHLGLLCLCLVLGLGVLLIPGLPAGDDILFHLYRMEHLAEALRRGHLTLPILQEPFGGYGYGVSLFYCDLLLYPPAMLRALGLPLIPCVKAYVLALTLLMGWTCYLCAWRMSRSCFAGMAAGLLTCWSSYLATDLFNRFAFGEFLAFALLPTCLLGYWEILQGKVRRWWLLSLGMAGVLVSHNLSFLMSILLFGGLFLIQLRSWLLCPARLGHLVLSALVCLLLTLFFWGGMLEQMVSQRFTFMDVAHADISWRALPWWRVLTGMPDQGVTGNGHVWCPPGVGTLLPALCLWRVWNLARRRCSWQFCDGVLTMGLFCCVMSSELAPWAGILRHTPLASLQFPWRFLQGATCFLGIGCGVALGESLGGEWRLERRWIGVLLVWCGLLWGVNAGAGYWRGVRRSGMVHEAVELQSLECGVMHYFPSGLTEARVYERGDRVTWSGGIRQAKMERLEGGGISCSFQGDNGVLELPLVHYRGYAAFLETGESLGNPEPGERLSSPGRASLEAESVPLTVFDGGNGLVSVWIPPLDGGGTVRVGYAGTLVQRWGRLVSVLTGLSLAGLGLARRRRLRSMSAPQ